MSLGLRRACVNGAKEADALEHALISSIRNHQALPAKYSASPYATKYTVSLLLRFISPVIAHRLKATNLFCSVASVHDVALANDATLPIKIVVEERDGRDGRDRDAPPGKRHKPSA